MTAEQWRDLRDSFDQVLDLPAGERSSFLADLGRRDECVGRELALMLESHAREDEFLDQPAASSGVVSHALSMIDEPPRSEALDTGQQIDGRYEIASLLGEGGFGTVYLAIDSRLAKRKVVIKVLKQLREEVLAKRFQEEIRALSQVDHPGIVAPVDSGRLENGAAYVVMQYVPGPTLRDVLYDGPVTPPRAIRILKQLCEALHAAHGAGILHRDLKPSNVILRDEGKPEERAILIDFGIARTEVAAARETQTTMVAGSPEYMAPEQLLGRASTATDVYALALLAFEMCTGKRLLREANAGTAVVSAQKQMRQVRPALPAAVIQSVERALASEAKNRPQTAAEFSLGLSQEARLSRKWPIAVVAAALLLGGLGFAAWVGHRPATPAVAPNAVELRASLALRAASGSPKPFHPPDSMHGGDGLEVTLEASQAGYIYLFDESVSPKGSSFGLLFPGSDGTSRLDAKKPQRIPQTGASWLEFDGKSPEEDLWIVWSKNPVKDLDDLQVYSRAPTFGAMPVSQNAFLHRFFSKPLPSSSSGQLAWESGGDTQVARIVIPVH